jgi:DNA-3-methyladenine glycosylase I
MEELQRCAWVAPGYRDGKFPEYREYHDVEWGVPVYNDRKQFEFLVLESAQAGLSWATVLKKRDAYREAFAQFKPEVVATFGDAKLGELLQNKGLIRNKAKLAAAINNARRFLEVQKEQGSFSSYIWSFVENKPIINHWPDFASIPTSTPLSDQISKDLRRRGFKFLGTTIVYAHLQATGLIMDHTIDCFRYKELKDISSK